MPVPLTAAASPLPPAPALSVPQAARMIRPVKQIASGAAEMIGSLEQVGAGCAHTRQVVVQRPASLPAHGACAVRVACPSLLPNTSLPLPKDTPPSPPPPCLQNNMNIRVPDGGEGGSKRLKFTHAEFHTSSMLSVVASLTPYSDFNQASNLAYISRRSSSTIMCSQMRASERLRTWQCSGPGRGTLSSCYLTLHACVRRTSSVPPLAHATALAPLPAVAAQHVPVPDGQADDGHACAGGDEIKGAAAPAEEGGAAVLAAVCASSSTAMPKRPCPATSHHVPPHPPLCLPSLCFSTGAGAPLRQQDVSNPDAADAHRTHQAVRASAGASTAGAAAAVVAAAAAAVASMRPLSPPSCWTAVLRALTQAVGVRSLLPCRYEHYCMDEFPNGTNAIVAVLAYTGGLLGGCVPTGRQAAGRSRAGFDIERATILDTCPAVVPLRHRSAASLLTPARRLPRVPVCAAGYDMEDAMILNKSSVERGFAHAYLYKNEQIDLREERGRCA